MLSEQTGNYYYEMGEHGTQEAKQAISRQSEAQRRQANVNNNRLGNNPIRSGPWKVWEHFIQDRAVTLRATVGTIALARRLVSDTHSPHKPLCHQQSFDREFTLATTKCSKSHPDTKEILHNIMFENAPGKWRYTVLEEHEDYDSPSSRAQLKIAQMFSSFHSKLNAATRPPPAV